MTIHIVLGAPLKAQDLDLNYQDGDLVLGVDGGSLLVKQAGYPLDLALGDFDSLNQQELEEVDAYAGQRFDKPDQDHTDFELSLDLAREYGRDDLIYVYNFQGGRIDHFISISYVVYLDQYKDLIPRLYLLDPANTVSFCQPGTYQIKKEPDKDYLSFIAMTKVSDLSLSGVKYPLENEDFAVPRALISNEFAGGEDMVLSFSQGLIMVVQSKG